MPELLRHDIANAAEVDSALNTQDWRIDYVYLIPQLTFKLQWSLGKQHRGRVIRYSKACKIVFDDGVPVILPNRYSKSWRHVIYDDFRECQISLRSLIYWKIKSALGFSNA